MTNERYAHMNYDPTTQTYEFTIKEGYDTIQEDAEGSYADYSFRTLAHYTAQSWELDEKHQEEKGYGFRLEIAELEQKYNVEFQ